MKKIKIYISLFLICLITGCATQSTKHKAEKIYYSSSGFALIYNDLDYKNGAVSRKLNNEKIGTIHSILKPFTSVKIINPENSNFIETKITKKGNYSNIFNIVLTKEIAKILELDADNPYVEIFEIKKNKKFVAKEGNTFDEERKVAQSVPVDEVKIDDLSKDKTNNDNKNTENKNYFININNFYYFDSANNLKIELSKKITTKNLSIEKINDTKYRLYAGPFKNFSSLKSTYISLNNLGFDDLNIYRK